MCNDDNYGTCIRTQYTRSIKIICVRGNHGNAVERIKNQIKNK